MFDNVATVENEHLKRRETRFEQSQVGCSQIRIDNGIFRRNDNSNDTMENKSEIPRDMTRR